MNRIVRSETRNQRFYDCAHSKLTSLLGTWLALLACWLPGYPRNTALSLPPMKGLERTTFLALLTSVGYNTFFWPWRPHMDSPGSPGGACVHETRQKPMLPCLPCSSLHHEKACKPSATSSQLWFASTNTRKELTDVESHMLTLESLAHQVLFSEKNKPLLL